MRREEVPLEEKMKETFRKMILKQVLMGNKTCAVRFNIRMPSFVVTAFLLEVVLDDFPGIEEMGIQWQISEHGNLTLVFEPKDIPVPDDYHRVKKFDEFIDDLTYLP